MRWPVIVVAAGCAFAAAPAGADTTSWHAILDGDVAATDNVFATPSGGLGSTPHEADIYVQIRPGVLFAYDAPKMVHELSAQLEVLEYVRNFSTPSLTFRGGWHGFFSPSPRTEIATQILASTGTLNSLTPRSSPDQTAIVVQPSGNIDVDQAEANEHVVYQTSRETRLIESAYGRFTSTDDNMGDTVASLEAGATLGFERVWRATSLGVEVGAAYLRFDRTDAVPDAIGFGNDHQLDPHAYVIFRHDFDRHWTANANAGVVFVVPTIGGRPDDEFPVAGAQVGYSDLWGTAGVQVSRAVAADLFIAENTVADSISANVNLPLPWLRGGLEPALYLRGSAGYSRTQLVDSGTGALASNFDLVRADIGVAWLARPGMTFGVRYEFLDQSGDSAATTLIPGFTRSTVFFSFAIRWPPREAGEVPRRTGMRADGRDLTPIGDEVVVPDAPAPAADGTSNGAGGGGGGVTPPPSND